MAFKSVLPNFKQIQAAVAEQEKKGTSYDNPLIFKPKIVQGQSETNFRIRFLPIAESATNNPWIKVSMHMFERPGDGKFVKLIDPRSFDKSATNPVAAYATKLWNSDNEVDKTMAKKLFAKERYFSIVYVKEAPANQKQFEGKVLIFEFGKKLYDKLSTSIKSFGKCFWDPFKGQDFLLIIKETASEKSENKWPDYSTSDWYGDSGVPIVDDETLMESISLELEKVSIKKEIVEKIGIKSLEEMKNALFGGLESMDGPVATPKKASKPAEDLTAPTPKAKVTKEPDFGTVEKPKQKAEAEPKADVKIEPKKAAPVVEEPASDDIDLSDIEDMLKDESFT